MKEAENQGTTFDSEYDVRIHHKQQMTSPRKQSNHMYMKQQISESIKQEFERSTTPHASCGQAGKGRYMSIG